MSDTDTTYIVRRAPQQGRKVRHYLTPRLNVSQIDENRATGRTLGGLFREVESTGRKIKGVLRIRTAEADTVDGHGCRANHGDHVRTNPEAVKALVRRVRPEELAAIAEQDTVIAGIEAELTAARAVRAELTAEAWRKAHVVTVKELETLAGMRD